MTILSFGELANSYEFVLSHPCLSVRCETIYFLQIKITLYKFMQNHQLLKYVFSHARQRS